MNLIKPNRRSKLCKRRDNKCETVIMKMSHAPPGFQSGLHNANKTINLPELDGRGGMTGRVKDETSSDDIWKVNPQEKGFPAIVVLQAISAQ